MRGKTIEASVINVNHLKKQYGSYTAINNLSFSVNQGEVFGLLGPNGAGKTTILECIEGLRSINGGKITICGCNPQTEKQKLRKIMGVQLQSSSLPDSIRVGEALSLMQSWNHVHKTPELLQHFEIFNLLKKTFGQLSMGQKRQLQLVLALINIPQILVLDEPTAGLDVQSRTLFHEAIKSARNQGITVFLATHDMAEAETLCDRISILIKGDIVVSGSPEEVTAAGSKETSIRLRTAKNLLLPGCSIKGADFDTDKNGYLKWNCTDVTTALTDLLKQIQMAGDTIEDLRVERPSLEERFLEVVEGAVEK
ncbi:MAG: ABC transporter ATP-binding protein [Eubacteriales bacterium]